VTALNVGALRRLAAQGRFFFDPFDGSKGPFFHPGPLFPITTEQEGASHAPLSPNCF
jgi:hypothetical protein